MRRSGIVGAAALVALAFLSVRPAYADDPAPPASAPAQSAAASSPLDHRAPDVAIALMRATRKVETVERQLATATARTASAQAALQQTDQQITDNQRTIQQVKDVLRERAVAVYTRGSGSTEAVLDVESVNDLGTARNYARAALDVDDARLAALNRTVEQLDEIRGRQQGQYDGAAADVRDLSAQRAQVVADRDDDQRQLDAWGAVPVMGQSWLTPGQLAGWYRSTGAVPKLAPGTTIDDIARLYVIEGDAEHVRGDLAFAQAIIETASFSVAAGNNYSGIGVCDSCTGGYAFPTPLDGVRAQIQLLRNYADPDSRARALANVPSPALYGSDPEKAASTYDTFFLKGKAPLWNQMGRGNWATDPTYSGKIIGLYAQMLAFASAHPDL